MISLHSEPHKAISNAFSHFCQAFVSLRQLIFDPLLGLNASQRSLLFGPRREFWLSRKKLYAPQKEFYSPKAILASLKEIIRCPKEEWLLIRFWNRRTVKMSSCTKHSIALRRSHTFSGKLETEFFANKFSTMIPTPKWFKLIMKKEFTFQSTASNDLGALRAHGKSKISPVITC